MNEIKRNEKSENVAPQSQKAGSVFALYHEKMSRIADERGV